MILANQFLLVSLRKKHFGGVYAVQGSKPTAPPSSACVKPCSLGTTTHLHHTRPRTFFHPHGCTRKSSRLPLPHPYCIWLPLSSLPLNSTTSLLPLIWMTEAASKEDFLPPFLSWWQLFIPTVVSGNVLSVLRLQLAVFPSKVAHNFLCTLTDFRNYVLGPHFLPFSLSHDLVLSIFF